MEVGKQIAALVSAASVEAPVVYGFDNFAYPITARGSKMSDWEEAFSELRASGGTSIGSPLELMRRRKQWVEQVIIVTDERENDAPYFSDVYEKYTQELGPLDVVIVKVGRCKDKLERELRDKRVSVDGMRFNGDYYALPNILPLLAQSSRLELILKILETPLPRRPESTKN